MQDFSSKNQRRRTNRELRRKVDHDRVVDSKRQDNLSAIHRVARSVVQ